MAVLLSPERVGQRGDYLEPVVEPGHAVDLPHAVRPLDQRDRRRPSPRAREPALILTSARSVQSIIEEPAQVDGDRVLLVRFFRHAQLVAGPRAWSRRRARRTERQDGDAVALLARVAERFDHVVFDEDVDGAVCSARSVELWGVPLASMCASTWLDSDADKLGNPSAASRRAPDAGQDVRGRILLDLGTLVSRRPTCTPKRAPRADAVGAGGYEPADRARKASSARRPRVLLGLLDERLADRGESPSSGARSPSRA